MIDVQLTDDSNNVVSELSYIRDSNDRVVVMELNTPLEHRGKGYARKLLSKVQVGENQLILVVSTDYAVGYYRKLGFVEVAPYVFERCEPMLQVSTTS